MAHLTPDLEREDSQYKLARNIGQGQGLIGDLASMNKVQE